MIKVYKVILTNLVVLIFGVFFIEFIMRIYLVIINDYEFSFLKNPGAISQDKFRSILEYSDVVGYLPIKNAQLTVDIPHWNNAYLSINSLQFRNGTSDKINMRDPILVVGDSFVFGNQVNDYETWPAYLQKYGYNVFNMGVPGYGTAQSLLWLKTFIDRNYINPKIVILQTLVGFDFYRDKLDFRDGFPSTAVFSDINNSIKYFCPNINHIDIPGSKYSINNEHKTLFIKLAQFSHILNILFSKEIEIYKKRLTREYKYSLSKKEIIDFTLTEFKKLPYKKIFLLQYGGDNTEDINEERKYILNKLNELDILYIDTYNATRIKDKPINKLYYNHHTAQGNKVIADYIKSTNLLN